MYLDIIKYISESTGIRKENVKSTLKLLNEGATIPFISRYRKEWTGSLDEVEIEKIKLSNDKFIELEKRKDTIIKSIDDQGKLTSALKDKIISCLDLSILEDLYLPFKQKRKTRAVIARENGLEPLAKIIMTQKYQNILQYAKGYLSKNVKDIEEALAGARDIIAEWMNENLSIREKLRRLFRNDGIVKSSVIKGKEEEGIKYSDYFKYEEKLKKIPSHRMLAIRRGDSEGYLRVSISPSKEIAQEIVEKQYVKGYNKSSEQVILAAKDSYKRLLAPSLETEFFGVSKEAADKAAIQVFSENLKQLMLASPLGQKNILAIDPGYRSGCKIVCLDKQGNLLHNSTIYPHKPQDDKGNALKKLSNLISTYKTEAVAIGNGTAGRETEALIKKLKTDREIQVFIVNEDGASVYSASSIGREEFPEYDVTVRGAVSIGRRLMDPMAELVKLDPKSIGVGQYQHDVDQTKLKESLTRVVEYTVNSVGVNLNTSSRHLLSYISGLGPKLAENIIEHRKANGPFKTRKELLKVDRMGAKSYEQCVAFLRIPESKDPLDNSGVHPESYHIVNKMAKDLKCKVSDIIESSDLRLMISPDKYIDGMIGLPTIRDILKELEKPGLDPRKKARVMEFAKGIHSIDDLEVGMTLPGIVSNITSFGAFVDIGVKQDGLVHISNLANKFISNPADYVKLHQHVQVKVIEIDVKRKRIQLSMKDADQ